MLSSPRVALLAEEYVSRLGRLEIYFLDSKFKFDLTRFVDNYQKYVIFTDCSDGACKPVSGSAVG